MAKKPAATKSPDEIPPAMDYAQHEATWNGVMALTKWTIIALLLIILALYCFIEAGQPVLGTLLLLVIPVGAVVLAVSRSRSTT
jgi:hypothetical protein